MKTPSYQYISAIAINFIKPIEDTTLISSPMLVCYGIAFLYLIKKHGPYKLSFYGLNLNNWRYVLYESILWTSIASCLLILIKLTLISTRQELQNQPLFLFQTVHFSNRQIFFSIIYGLSSLIQEFMFRGVMQSIFHVLFTGKYSNINAIMVSTLIFSTIHIYISVWLAFAVVIPSIFWGIMYTRHKSLLGVCLSHIVIGELTFYALALA